MDNHGSEQKLMRQQNAYETAEISDLGASPNIVASVVAAVEPDFEEEYKRHTGKKTKLFENVLVKKNLRSWTVRLKHSRGRLIRSKYCRMNFRSLQSSLRIWKWKNGERSMIRRPRRENGESLSMDVGWRRT
jgi:hypothetical protein